MLDSVCLIVLDSGFKWLIVAHSGWWRWQPLIVCTIAHYAHCFIPRESWGIVATTNQGKISVLPRKVCLYPCSSCSHDCMSSSLPWSLAEICHGDPLVKRANGWSCQCRRVHDISAEHLVLLPWSKHCGKWLAMTVDGTRLLIMVSGEYDYHWMVIITIDVGNYDCWWLRMHWWLIITRLWWKCIFSLWVYHRIAQW